MISFNEKQITGHLIILLCWSLHAVVKLSVFFHLNFMFFCFLC